MEIVTLNNKLSYTDYEKIVGTWFGELLYSKTFYIPQLPNSSYIHIDISPIAYQNVRKLEGIALSPEGACQLDFYHPNTYGVVMQVLGKFLEITTYNDKRDMSAYVSIYYIK